jgi:hypothetical protein
MRRALVTLMCVAACALAASPAGAAPVISGGGAGIFPPVIPAFAGDRLQMAVHATIGADGAVKGIFEGQHHFADGGHFAIIHGTIDCVAVSGNRVVLTGVITHGFDIRGIDPTGARVSIELIDGDPQIMGVDVSYVSGHPIPPCTSSPILVVPMSEGAYKIH